MEQRKKESHTGPCATQAVVTPGCVSSASLIEGAMLTLSVPKTTYNLTHSLHIGEQALQRTSNALQSQTQLFIPKDPTCYFYSILTDSCR